MNRFLIPLLLLLIAAVGTPAAGTPMELEEGILKVVFQERFGSFTPYLKVSETAWIPLWVDKDPRTSYVTLLVGNETYRLGRDITGTPGNLQRSSEGTFYLWNVAGLEVKQLFTFLRSKDSLKTDALQIVLEIQNFREEEVSVGVRYTLDTYLGEKSQKHFRTGKFSSIDQEASFTPDRENWFLVSEDSEMDLGMMVLLQGEGVSPVEEVVLANWKRLTEASWKYVVNPIRNFTLLPYSINDSAAALYYPIVRIHPRQTRKIVTVLGNKGTGVYTATGSTTFSLEDILKETAESDFSKKERKDRLEEELKRVEEFIMRINQRASDFSPVSSEELEVYKKILEELKKRTIELESN